MIRRRFLIVPLIFFFSLLAFFNAFAFCLQENEVSARSTGQIPSSIPCLDNEENPYLFEAFQGHKKFHFSKTEKRAMGAYHEAPLHGGLFHRALLPSSGTISIPSSIPIYQLKTVYLI